jgi:hypothetical protein
MACSPGTLREWLLALKRANLAGLSESAVVLQCDPFGIPSTSHWTGAAIIVQSQRTTSCIVMRSRTSTGPMPSSLAE